MSQVDKVESYNPVVASASEMPVEENNSIRLSAEDQKSLAEEILNPPAPTPALLRAKETYARIIRKAC